MEIQIQDYPNFTVAEVSGEIDGRTAPELEKTLSPLFREGAALLIDMTGTKYMSSAGLRSLLLLHREALARSARLTLVGVCQDIEEVMSITGFLRFFSVTKTLEEALPGSFEEQRAPDADSPDQRSA
jgi:anti-sigma B factor antagonist